MITSRNLFLFCNILDGVYSGTEALLSAAWATQNSKSFMCFFTAVCNVPNREYPDVAIHCKEGGRRLTQGSHLTRTTVFGCFETAIKQPKVTKTAARAILIALTDTLTGYKCLKNRRRTKCST
jgi:hypothetical protein